MNWPNRLTLLRIFLVPVMIVFYYIDFLGHFYWTLGVFIVASLTDMFDGMLARKFNLVSNFGKLMDPMADKLLIGSAVIMLTASGCIHPVITIILIGREFIISAFRVVAASSGLVLAADFWGKLKTVVQTVAVCVLIVAAGQGGAAPGEVNMFALFSSEPFMLVGTILIWISALLSIISCANYILGNREVIKQ